MIVKIVEKPRHKHVNPPLVAGHVYQELDSKGYYYACSVMDSSKGEKVITLFSLYDGKSWSSFGGFGAGITRFIDVTEQSTFTVEI